MQNPSIIVLFTSYRCNARCIMCSAWQKQKKQEELSVDHIRRIFSDRVLSNSIRIINITGGEPTLREDLIEIVRILIDNCVNLKRIDIPTNGINTIEAIDRIEQVLAYLLQTEIKLTVSVSIDGVGDIHDKVRGSSGAFEKANKSIDELKELAILYPSFSIGMNATVNRLNYRDLDNIIGYADKKALGVNFTLSALSDIGVESLPQKNFFKLEAEERKAASVFIEGLLKTSRINVTYANFLLHWLKTGERMKSCAFRKGISILCEPDGSVYRCGNFKDFKIGNLLSKSFEQSINSRNNFQSFYEAKCKNCNSNCYIDALF